MCYSLFPFTKGSARSHKLRGEGRGGRGRCEDGREIREGREMGMRGRRVEGGVKRNMGKDD